MAAAHSTVCPGPGLCSSTIALPLPPGPGFPRKPPSKKATRVVILRGAAAGHLGLTLPDY
ncbi:hypothetical protein PC120_g24283 [Phytophthora cactorum]|nr:hypothetical protein PC120_g24283 [Phytophthora cactorum]